jgi:hypothetical protein
MCEVGPDQPTTVPVTVEFTDGSSKVVGYHNADETAEEWAMRLGREQHAEFDRLWREFGFEGLFGEIVEGP